MLIILIDRCQVLSYLIRVPLLNQANNAIWQKSWSTSIVLTVFPWILEVNASKEEKRACPFSSLTPRRKKTTKSFCKVWASKLAESDKGSYYNQEKGLKDDKASEKPIETTAKSSFVEFKNYKIALSHSKVTTISIYPYLGHLKSNLSSSPFFNSSFIYLPTGIWETTRSRSSCRGYFQIFFPCKHCKWTKHYFIILFYKWPRSIEIPILAPSGWRKGSDGEGVNGRLITCSLASPF